MKPINFENENCESKSANCVIWPGPDVECISLKKGHSVSWAIYTLAKKVCELEALVNIENYDVSKMSSQFGEVTDFKKMIQNLINKAYNV